MSTKTYSSDLRIRVVRAVEDGMTRPMAARLFEVSICSVGRWVGRHRREGTVAARQRGGYKVSPLDAHKDWLLGLIAGEPDLTLKEIRDKLAERGISSAVGSVWRFYDRQGISFKKSGARGRAGPGGRGGVAPRLEGKSARP